jgi:hypothetical protein
MTHSGCKRLAVPEWRGLHEVPWHKYTSDLIPDWITMYDQCPSYYRLYVMLSHHVIGWRQAMLLML